MTQSGDSHPLSRSDSWGDPITTPESRRTLLTRLVDDSLRCGIGLSDWVDRCLDLAPYDLDRPFYDLDDDDEQCFIGCVASGRYDLSFHLGCGENPFLTYADEPGLYFVLGLRSDRVVVELCAEDGPPLGREERTYVRGQTLIDVAEVFAELANSPRFCAPIRRYLERWAVLRASRSELEAAAHRIAKAFGVEAYLEIRDGMRPWQDWFDALADEPAFRQVSYRMSALGSPDVDAQTLDALLRIVERSEDDLRLALETSLVVVGKRANLPTSSTPARLERASLTLRALAAPDEGLPAILEQRVRTLIDRMIRPAAFQRAASTRDLDTESKGRIADTAVLDRLGELAERFSWNHEETGLVESALADRELRIDVELVEQLEYFIGKYDATARLVACALRLRNWCESEGYGSRLEELDPDTRVLIPPSLEVMFRFVKHFPETPEVEDAIATLDDWIQQRFVDPREFENDMFRHLRLIAYTEQRGDD